MLPFVDTAVLHGAHQLDDNAFSVRDVRSVLLSAGPELAGSLLPAIINLLDGGGAVSPDRAAAPAEEARQRLDTVAAVAFAALSAISMLRVHLAAFLAQSTTAASLGTWLANFAGR